MGILLFFEIPVQWFKNDS